MIRFRLIIFKMPARDKVLSSMIRFRLINKKIIHDNSLSYTLVLSFLLFLRLLILLTVAAIEILSYCFDCLWFILVRLNNLRLFSKSNKLLLSNSYLFLQLKYQFFSFNQCRIHDFQLFLISLHTSIHLL